MKTILRALGAAFVTAGVLAVPSVALAAEDVPLFGALTERDANGRSVTYPIHRGETIPVVLGVTNRGTAPSAGVVVNIRTFNDLNLPKSFTNCLYYTDSNLDGAWCEFEPELPVGGTYALSPFEVSAEDDAEDISGSIVFQWFPKDWADENGGIKKFAERDSRGDQAPVAGTGAKLALEPRELPVPAQTERVGFAFVKLVIPATTPPTTAPTTAPTSAPTATPTGTDAAPATTPPADGGGSGGGLPVTGINAVAIAGVGGLLLVAGVVAFLVTRRRNKFTA
ncbi:LPXTG cell wall anchor domain-containing protein [Actinoplanes sp. NPDC048967]|uniref:LPXTG cell wall anchor domain-containing protein n=1 Tax=Actinoplanes sp. NPDC048967 TaxID=3155269 RepID=UPI0034088E82